MTNNKLILPLLLLLPLSAVASPPSPRVAAVAHSHFMRNSAVPFERCRDNLVEWIRANGVRAFGVGSPWSAKQAADMRMCERDRRDEYYAGRLDRAALLDADELYATLAALSNACPGVTFFSDNETPKNRYGHMWYIGYTPVVPGWHDYSQDRRTAFTEKELEDPSLDRNAITGKAHFRRPYADVVAEQRSRGALAIWAHPTSWWLGRDGKFITNIAADMPAQLLVDGGLGGITVMGYDPYHRHYEELWFAILDMGYRVPGLAEQDCSPGHGIAGKKDEKILNYIPDCDHAPTVEEFKDAVRNFRTTMSSGPDLRLMSLAERGGTVEVEVYAAPAPGERTLSLVEIVGRGGRVRAALRDVGEGTHRVSIPAEEGDSWFVARCFGEGCSDYAARPQQEIRVFAITNPMWLASAPPPPAPVKPRMPYMENPEVRRLMDYLAEGRFRDADPGLKPGEVPASAFNFAAFAAAL